MLFSFFFFNDTATTEIYTLSLHDALPIYPSTARHLRWEGRQPRPSRCRSRDRRTVSAEVDRKSTRLNSSHQIISYAVFCLKKKKTRAHEPNPQIAIIISRTHYPRRLSYYN